MFRLLILEEVIENGNDGIENEKQPDETVIDTQYDHTQVSLPQRNHQPETSNTIENSV